MTDATTPRKFFGTLSESEKLNDWIYIYFIENEFLIYDRTVSRRGLGLARAKERVKHFEEKGLESFYTIGTLPRIKALS